MRLLVEHVGIEKSGVHWRRLFGCTDGQEGGGGEKERLGVVEDGFMNALTGEEEEAGRDGGKDEAAEDTEVTIARTRRRTPRRRLRSHRSPRLFELPSTEALSQASQVYCGWSRASCFSPAGFSG